MCEQLRMVVELTYSCQRGSNSDLQVKVVRLVVRGPLPVFFPFSPVPLVLVPVLLLSVVHAVGVGRLVSVIVIACSFVVRGELEQSCTSRVESFVTDRPDIF